MTKVMIFVVCTLLVVSITFIVLYSTKHCSVVQHQKQSVIPDGTPFTPGDQPSKTHRKNGGTTHKFPAPDNLDDLERQARANFVLSRYSYSQTLLNKSPLVSIVTRTYNRPLEIQKNIASCNQMIHPDFEHVILHDQVGAGMQVAEAALYAFRNEFLGEYICHLDDDDLLSNHYFIDLIRDITSRKKYKVIIFKVWYDRWKKLFPTVWHQFPHEGQIATCNVLIRRDIYIDKENAGCVAQVHAGDYTFIHNVLLSCDVSDICWLDEVIFTVRSPTLLSPSDFVTVELSGGLGNQLFEIASAYAYAQKHHKTFILDHSMKVLPGSPPRATYFDMVYPWIQNNPQEKVSWNLLEEKGFAYQPLPFHYGSVHLKGYFQSSAYFMEYKDFFRKSFNQLCTVRLPLEIASQSIPLVSFHIRRTDYVQHALHTQQSSTYYLSAVSALRTQLGVKNLCLVVFSDDVAWCKSHVETWWSQDISFFYISNYKDYEDLYLMTLCDHHIIANSSFSWWGSYLDPKETAQTVAPKIWFNDATYDWSTIYEPHWIVV